MRSFATKPTRGDAWILDLGSLPLPLDLDAAFGRTGPVALEIGPGGGEWAIGMARAHPLINLLAVEYKHYRVGNIAARLDRYGITTVRVAWAEASEFMRRAIGGTRLDAIHVNFPDPWPKRRHRHRRLLQPAFLEGCIAVLKPGGVFTMATDVQDYAADVAAHLGTLTQLENLHPATTLVDSVDGHFQTVFEKRFRAQGLPIFFLQFRRRP